MKHANLLTALTAVMLASCAGTSIGEATIGKQDIAIDGKRMTPEALWAMGRIGEVAVSPDGQQIAYTVTYYSVEQNKGNSEIFVIASDGTANKQLTSTPQHEGGLAWIKAGTKIAFVSDYDGSSQVYEINPDGTGRKRLTDFEGGIEAFSVSPDGKKMLFVSQVAVVESTASKHPDLPKASGVIVDDLMYKHWDEWKTTAPHPFVADFDGAAISNPKDLLEGEPYECPMKPFGGIEQLAWSPNSDKIAYTCRKKTGLEYAVSTNSDIYIYDLESGETVNITQDNKGYDMNPQYSPDGRYIAWQSMERDGYEADLNRLMVMDLATGEKTFLSKDFESNVDAFKWSADGSGIYFLGVWHGESQIYRICVGDGSGLEKLTSGLHDYASVDVAGDKIIAKRHSMSCPDDIYSVDGNGNATQLTFENKHILDQIEMGAVEQRWITTSDGKQMLTWVVLPPGFNASKSYSALLYCEGGPQTPLSQFWSYRWNLQIMAAHGYVVVAPCRRGMPGFGIEWNEQISGDYGGQCMRDYLAAIDALSQEPFIDSSRLGCVGASFGGYSVYWLAGNHDGRFKAFIAHDGIFNMEMQYLETEEKWFANWDMGGPFWDTGNAVAMRTFANSPHRFVDKWDTPILCIHGEKDYRILANQAMAAFDAAIMRGVPAKLLIFPDENHWVLKPQNGILWQRTFFEWLAKWLQE